MIDDNLDEMAVAAALGTNWLGRPYYYAVSIDSTNDRLKARAGDPAYPNGTVLLADFQSAGRGRMERQWEAPPGTSLLFSALLRPDLPVERGAWLVMAAGLAVAEAIEVALPLSVGLKWPNDVVLEDGNAPGGWRKVCGMLLDTSLDPAGRLESAVIGIGLNVNIPPEALPPAITPATSLLAIAGAPVARRPLLIGLLERLERRFDAVLGGASPAPEWAARLVTLGQPVEVSAVGAAESLAGVAEGIDEWGQLLVRDAAGRLHTVAAGDVTLRGH